MLVREAMTAGAETIGPGETLQAAAAKMRETGVGALVVRDGERVIGIVTDRDIVMRSVAEGRSPLADVASAMTPQVVECCEDEEIETAALRMQQGAVRRVVVLDATSRLVGLLSVDDVALRSPALAGEIREHVRAPERPIQRGPWLWWEEPAS